MNIDLYCLTCHMDMYGVVEGVEHLLEGHIVESHPEVIRG